ncbi:fimbrial protein [Pseudomonas aeruginosa]
MIGPKILVVVLLLAFLPKSYALICTSTGGGVQDSTTVETTVAISNSMPKGTVLWRQNKQTATTDCWVDINGASGEYVYFYVNPNKVDLGPDLEVGVTYQGQDYLYSSLPDGRLNTNMWVNGCGPVPDRCGREKERKTFEFSIFLAKKSPAGGPKEGELSSIKNYIAFQFDGEWGVRPGMSYNFTVKGLDSLRYIPCSSKLTVIPSTVDFGRISLTSPVPQVNQVVKQVPFNIVEQRTCLNSSAVYGLNAYLTPIKATLADSNTTLVPKDNSSVGINLLRAETQVPLVFNKEVILTHPTAAQISTHRFLASLKWRTAKPKLGTFNAGAAIDIYYK